MALHRAEQILAAVSAKLIAANTDAMAKVERARNTQYSDGDFTNNAALNILMGSDDPLGQGYTNLAFMDSELQVFVDLHISSTTDHLPETALNQLRKQAHVALMADRTIGLAFVIAIVPAGASEPTFQADREFVVHKQRTRWRVQYRSSITDPSA